MSEFEFDCLRLDQQLCFPLYAAARKVTGQYTPYFKELGLTYTQYIVFMVLWEKDEVTVGDICRRLYLDSGTLTPLLKKMEEKGWLQRTRSRQDERIVIVTLTEEGRKMKERCQSIPASISKCIHLSPDDAAALYRILYQILEEDE
jgi:DNA-binding MarR family transcriptional regulator